MKTPRTTLQARFEPDTRFEVVPVFTVPFRGTGETELEQFKNRLLRQTLEETVDVEFYAPLRRAANEAAAVAWTTPFPLLFFPALFEEKVSSAGRQLARAKSIRARSSRLLAKVKVA